MLGIPTPPELGAGNATSPLVVGGPLAIGPSVPRAILDMPLASDLSLRRGVGVATFTRSTIGTFIDRIDGLVKTAAIDAARFEQNGILFEGASTWEALHNRDFTNAVHVKTNITAVKDAIGANGVVNAASTLTATAANGTAFQTITKASAENTFSLDVRRKTGTGTIEITDDGGSTFTDITASINSVSYARFQITTTQANPSIGLRIVTSGDEVEVDYEGLEALPFASSRIEVTTTSVTRTADNLSIDAANIPAPTADYSVSIDFDLLGFVTSGFPRLYAVVGETSRFTFINNTNGFVSLRHGAVDSVGTTVVSAGVSTKFTGTVGASNQTIFINGVQEDQDVKGTVTGTKTSIAIGDQGAGSSTQIIWGHIKNFRIYDVALTAAQVGAL